MTKTFLLDTPTLKYVRVFDANILGQAKGAEHEAIVELAEASQPNNRTLSSQVRHPASARMDE
jgi:hypothetical protein